MLTVSPLLPSTVFSFPLRGSVLLPSCFVSSSTLLGANMRRPRVIAADTKRENVGLVGGWCVLFGKGEQSRGGPY